MTDIQHTSFDFRSGRVRFQLDNGKEGQEPKEIIADILDLMHVMLITDDELSALKLWFQHNHDVTITTTQALRIKALLTKYYLDFKKKFCRELGLLIGTRELMPQPNQTPP